MACPSGRAPDGSGAGNQLRGTWSPFDTWTTINENGQRFLEQVRPGVRRGAPHVLTHDLESVRHPEQAVAERRQEPTQPTSV